MSGEDLIYPAKGNLIWGDDFTDGKIDDGWTRVDPPASSHLTWYEQQGKMVADHDATADASASSHFLMRALPAGASPPFTVETRIEVLGPYNATHAMSGIIFADGLTVSSGTQQWYMVWQTTSPYLAHAQRDFSGYNSESASEVIPGQYLGAPWEGMYLRFTWDSTNSFTCAVSIDSIHWAHSLTRTRTLTPAYVGIAAGNWGAASQHQVSYDYVRMYSVADPQFLLPKDTL